MLAALICGWILVAGSHRSGADEINSEWRNYGADKASTKYSPLDQIGKGNVQQLEIAWQWNSPDNELIAANRRLRTSLFKATPLMVGGVLYTSTSLCQVVAIDAATGETIWVYDPKSYEAGRPANTGFQHRGVSYWTDGEDERILIATGDRHLIAINAKTGKIYPDFGEDGKVDLAQGLGREINPRSYTINSPPIICRDVAVVGSVIFDFPTTQKMAPGHVRGFDVRTGEQKWIFHTIPQEGELGVETWEDGSWEYSGNTNVWSTMSADEELGYVYLPVGTPTNDWYGGHRPGDNLFADSIVCLNGDTGERVWHFQAVHHGLWDYDMPCAPILADVEVDGTPRKIVAQLSKQAICYVFDRATGEPIWPIEERPVPQSTAPGERTAPTQPFPTKPLPYDRHGISEDDLIDFTPELRSEALEIYSNYNSGPIFEPPVVENRGDDLLLGTLQVPSAGGGTVWQGGAFDPETGILYVPSMSTITVVGIKESDPNRSNLRYLKTGDWGVTGPEGLPLIKPPYGRITAIDLKSGEHIWMQPNGQGPVDHPSIAHLELDRLGSWGAGPLGGGGPLVTKSLFFITQGAGGYSGERNQKPQLRAHDKATGELIWEMDLSDTPGNGGPISYSVEGKQYIAFAIGGLRTPAKMIALSLP